MSAGLLVIMGSGETAPTMVKPHREIFQRCGDRPAVLLDTPYGFQENADDISAKAVKYFADSTGRRLSVVSWRTAPEPGLPRERALASLREAGWLFAGPGSPTYALRQWAKTDFPGVLAEALGDPARVVCFASAAALTLGSHTIPVYEIYKAGLDPHWVPGLDLFHQVTGLPAVLVPHYDNAEGGHHDTRFCYLGERRLAALESSLPSSAFIIGIDEHTAGLFDLASRTVRVVGNGGLTLRRAGVSQWWPAGTTLPFDVLAADPSAASATSPGAFSSASTGALSSATSAGAFPSGSPGATSSAASPGAFDAASTGALSSATSAGAFPSGSPGATSSAAPPGPFASASSASSPASPLSASDFSEMPVPTSLGAITRATTARFDECFQARDADGCVSAALDLEQGMQDWIADTDVSDERDQARAALRRMLVRLGGFAGPDRFSPLVKALVELRSAARSRKDWALGDALRDALDTAGVTVRDTPDGPEWSA